MKDDDRKIAYVLGALAGVVLSAPFLKWGFVLGGMLLGAATGGLLAIPGAVVGALIVISMGALVGWVVVDAIFVLRQALARSKKG